MKIKSLLLPVMLFFATAGVVVAVETGNLAPLWSDYQSSASEISAKETTLKKARDSGNSELAATRELYKTQLAAYHAYLLWVEEALKLYGDEQGGRVETVVSMAGAFDMAASASGTKASASATMSALETPKTMETVTQKNIYLTDLPEARAIVMDLSDRVGQIVDMAEMEEFASYYREQTAIVENLLYPIYTFTILSSLREANFALHDYIGLLEQELPSDGGAFELNQHRQTLQSGRSSLDEVSAQVVGLENTWQEIVDRTTYSNFLNQVRAVNGRLEQIQQSLREVNTYVNAGK